MSTTNPPKAVTTAEELFARVLIAEVVARAAMSLAIWENPREDQRWVLDELRESLTVNIVGESAEQVRELMHHRLDIEIAQIEQMLGIGVGHGGPH